MRVVIGTRGSKLALVQTEMVRDTLKEAYPEHDFELKIISTKGDRNQECPLNQLSAQGIFVREIEEQLLDKKIDMAVHSMKDMPANVREGLTFSKSWNREDPRDVLILREKNNLSELKSGSTIATGSIRRSSQLLQMRPDLNIVGIRGNVDTRIQKMMDQKLDGIVLAAAGLHRLGKESMITQYLSVEEMVPSPAQGVLGLELRENDCELKDMLDALSDDKAHKTALTERCFLSEMNADCHVPVGASCNMDEQGMLHLVAMFGDESGEHIAYATSEGKDPQEVARLAAKSIRQQLSGKVSLVGAGPGDPELITLKGMSCIRKADCIIYDRLSAPELLNEAPENCENIYVGKENRHHTLKQDEINQLLVDKAMQYDRVVRLKGGDVYVFGRGGEEGKYLRDRGVSFEAVPGISSSIAGLAYAGIPITHRGLSGGFHVVTAHSQQDELAEIDFEAMARGKDTCVFLMGLSVLPQIVRGLSLAGMSSDMPAAVISHATTAQQKTCIGTLSTIVDKVNQEKIESPALIVIGEVITMRDNLNWFKQKSLYGRSYLFARIGTDSSHFTTMMREKGARVDEIQVGNITNITVEFTKQGLKKYDWIIFTSKHGVQHFFENMKMSGLDARALGNLKIVVIGSTTASELKKYGLQPDYMPDAYNSEMVYEYLNEMLDSRNHVLYVTGKNIVNRLMELNCEIEKLEVYQNEEVDFEEIQLEMLKEYDGICFTCASSAKRFLGKYRKNLDLNELRDIKFYSIGSSCTKEILQHGIKLEQIVEAECSSYVGLVDAVEKL